MTRSVAASRKTIGPSSPVPISRAASSTVIGFTAKRRVRITRGRPSPPAEAGGRAGSGARAVARVGVRRFRSRSLPMWRSAWRISLSITVRRDTPRSPDSSVAVRSSRGEWTVTSAMCRCLSRRN